MANEVEVHELGGLRQERPVCPMPQTIKQTLSIGGAASAAFTDATVMICITTTTTCRVVIGPAPVSGGDTILVYSGMHNYFGVNAGHKVIAVAA